MKKITSILFAAILSLSLLSCNEAAVTDPSPLSPADYVNPLVGTLSEFALSTGSALLYSSTVENPFLVAVTDVSILNGDAVRFTPRKSVPENDGKMSRAGTEVFVTSLSRFICEQ